MSAQWREAEAPTALRRQQWPVSMAAASSRTCQCETSSARAPAWKKARARPERASAVLAPLAAVLQADRTTQSASSFSPATSEAGARKAHRRRGLSKVQSPSTPAPYADTSETRPRRSHPTPQDRGRESRFANHRRGRSYRPQLEDDTDLLLGRELPPGRSTNVSNGLLDTLRACWSRCLIVTIRGVTMSRHLSCAISANCPLGPDARQ